MVSGINCIYLNVNARNSKEHRKVKMSDEKMIKMYFQKASDLVRLGKTTAMNFDINGVRYNGRHMINVRISKDSVEFYYNDKEVVVDISMITNVRRLRTRKFLFTVKEVTKKIKQEAKKPSKKAKSKREEV